jgi:exonuclease SbcC
MSFGFRLTKLEVAAFRGVRDKVSIPLDRPLNIICGPNGSGKSTLTTAIEWALFPTEVTKLKETGIDERRAWEVRHLHGKQYPEVAVTLVQEGAEFTLRQYGVKGTIKRPALISCTYSDFKHLTYVHQETIRDFLVGQPALRQEAFGRLLGAGWAQDLAKALDKAWRELKCDEADRRVDGLGKLLDAKMAEVGRLVNEEEDKARREGLSEPWPEAGRGIAATVKKLVDELCTKASVPSPAVPDAEPFGAFPARLSEMLGPLRRVGPAQRHGELAGRRARVEAARSSWLEADLACGRRAAELEEFTGSAGSKEHIEQRLDEVARRRESLQQQLSALSRRRAVIREAIGFLKEAPEARQCPVCERDVPATLAQDLERRILMTASEAEKTLQEKLNGASGELRVLRSNLEQLDRLSQVVDRTRELLALERQKLENVLGEEIRPDEDPRAIAGIEIERLTAELDALQKAVDQWLREIARIEAEGKRMELVSRILGLQRRMNQLAEVRDTPEWQRMVEQHQALSRRERNLKLGSDTTRELATDLARRNLDRVREPICDTYSRLVQRADFAKVLIDPKKKYEVELESGGAVISPTAVLNLTDLNALAIGVIAGMATAFRDATGLDFLILDDPSQGMDAGVAERLGEVLGELSAKIQIVVATPDADLLTALERSPRRKNVIRLEPRQAASSRPCVRIASVSR